MCIKVQEKSTPFKKPKNNGGSPIGVNDPPILETKKIKNTTKCTLFFRHELALIRGRIKSIDAPVVPIMEASPVPIISNTLLSLGLPFKSPLIKIPPDTVNNANSSIINGRNSLK